MERTPRVVCGAAFVRPGYELFAFQSTPISVRYVIEVCPRRRGRGFLCKSRGPLRDRRKFPFRAIVGCRSWSESDPLSALLDTARAHTKTMNQSGRRFWVRTSRRECAQIVGGDNLHKPCGGEYEENQRTRSGSISGWLVEVEGSWKGKLACEVSGQSVSPISRRHPRGTRVQEFRISEAPGSYAAGRPRTQLRAWGTVERLN